MMTAEETGDSEIPWGKLSYGSKEGSKANIAIVLAQWVHSGVASILLFS